MALHRSVDREIPLMMHQLANYRRIYERLERKGFAGGFGLPLKWIYDVVEIS